MKNEQVNDNTLFRKEREVKDYVNDSIEAKAEGIKLINKSKHFFLITLNEKDVLKHMETVQVGLISFGPTKDLLEILVDYIKSNPMAMLYLKIQMMKDALGLNNKDEDEDE